jgi:hypothetical protein
VLERAGRPGLADVLLVTAALGVAAGLLLFDRILLAEWLSA